MNEASITKYITDTFDDVEIDEAMGDSFFCYDPEGNEPLNYRVRSSNAAPGVRADVLGLRAQPQRYDIPGSGASITS